MAHGTAVEVGGGRPRGNGVDPNTAGAEFCGQSAAQRLDGGKLPYFTSVQHYLESEHEAGNADVPDAESAADQFLGMIANYVLRPRMLLTDWNPAAPDIRYAVEQAVETMLARYTTDRPA
ncbi:TetR/AcrR family transcriptional regulator C-terminal domain-containing protein [Nocardia sp. NBC_01388]|uniref:TetR/AcrR family transcriptional regulator C-terminal domain-containing protein n=1 Tax=Nocardia sp. NBC_01388 TaxID=2903596 RepID=UPI003252CA12